MIVGVAQVLAQRVLSHPKITVMWNTVVEAFEGKRIRVLPNGLQVEIGEDGQIIEENYAKLRVKDIRERLDSAGINYAGVKEKDALVKLLRSALAEATAATPEDDSAPAGWLLCIIVCEKACRNMSICMIMCRLIS